MPIIWDPLWPAVLFEPLYPVQDVAELICGSAMIIVSVIVA